jgi:hypothetical protein
VSDIGPKGVMSFTLLRLGLTWGEGVKAYQSGRFNRNWGLLPVGDLSVLLGDLRKKMKTQPYGVGDALITLLGKAKAEQIALREGVVIRPVVAEKRSKATDGSSDVSESGPSKRRRGT